jgi:Flp pilus assembly protein TadG
LTPRSSDLPFERTRSGGYHSTTLKKRAEDEPGVANQSRLLYVDKKIMGFCSLIVLIRSLAIERGRSARQRAIRRGVPRVADERGQAMVEFAIIVPILLLIVVGILYFGRFLTYMSDTTHLANIAVRFAAVNSDPSCAAPTTPNNCTAVNLANYVKSTAVNDEFRTGSSDVPTPVKICVQPDPNYPNPTQGQPIKAVVTATFKVVPFLNITIPVSETATMMLEQTPDSSVYINDCSS